ADGLRLTHPRHRDLEDARVGVPAPPVLGVARDRLVGHLQLTPPWTAAPGAAASRTGAGQDAGLDQLDREGRGVAPPIGLGRDAPDRAPVARLVARSLRSAAAATPRSEEHTSEFQSR